MCHLSFLVSESQRSAVFVRVLFYHGGNNKVQKQSEPRGLLMYIPTDNRTMAHRAFFPWGGGGGGRLQYKMPRCVCWGSENVPIIYEGCLR